MRIKVGQIGKGKFGSKILCKLKHIEGLELEWVLGSKNKWWDYEAEWIIIASPSKFYYEQAKHFLKKGMNVFNPEENGIEYYQIEKKIK